MYVFGPEVCVGMDARAHIQAHLTGREGGGRGEWGEWRECKRGEKGPHMIWLDLHLHPQAVAERPSLNALLAHLLSLALLIAEQRAWELGLCICC